MSNKNLQPAPKRVRITKCSFEHGWYKNLIGQEFEVDNASPPKNFVLWEDYITNANIWRHIAQQDCQVVDALSGTPTPSTNNQREGEKILSDFGIEDSVAFAQWLIQNDYHPFPKENPTSWLQAGMSISISSYAVYRKFKKEGPIAVPTETPSLPVAPELKTPAAEDLPGSENPLASYWFEKARQLLVDRNDFKGQLMRANDVIVELTKRGLAPADTPAVQVEPDAFGRSRESSKAPQALHVEEVPEVLQMSDELAAQSDVAAIEYGKLCDHFIGTFQYDNSHIVEAHEKGQLWMYRMMQQELFSLRTQLSEAQNDRDIYYEWYKREKANLDKLKEDDPKQGLI